jgi:hypothetical protein
MKIRLIVMKNTNSFLNCINNSFYLLILLLIPSCASFNTAEKIAPSFTYAYESIKNAVIGYPDLNITREIVENIPYASALLKVGKGPEGLVILESIENDNFLWVSRDKIYIVTKDGRIKRSIGLPNNLTEITSINQSFKDLLTKPNPVTEYYSYYSFEEPTLFNLKVSIKITNKGIHEVEILGDRKQLILFEESISSELIGWKEKNKFWVDPDNYFIWKSEQNISPKLPKFTLQVTKRPSSKTP